MYNGIGLQTARGSGTNGYVQRNLSFVKITKNKIEYKTEEDFKRLEAEVNRIPNEEILAHQKKRTIELKCYEMRELMEEQGYSSEEIETKVNALRDALNRQMESMESSNNHNNKKEWLLDSERVNVKETHQMAELNHDKNDKLKNALGISPFFIEGSSLDATRKAKEALAAEALLQQKKYQLIKDPSPEPQVEEHKVEAKSHEKRKRKDKSSKKRHSRKHSSESESESDSDINESRTHKKKKKINSHERKIKEKKHSKRRDHKKRKHSKYSDSSSGSDSNSESSSGSTSSSSNSSSDSDSVSESESSSSSNSSNHKSSRKNKHSIRMGHKSSSSPEMTRKIRSQYNYKGSSFEKDDQKTSSLIEKNIKEVRKESDKSLKDNKHKDNEIEMRKYSRESDEQKQKVHDSRSRSSSNSSNHDSRVKRLKSAVYESDGSRKAKEIPKSYSYQTKSEPRNDRSLSPTNKSRHSSGSRHRSRSLNSNDSRSSRQYSRSSSASDESSRSVSRSRSRSRSIPRRKGSPSFLDKRRITRY